MQILGHAGFLRCNSAHKFYEWKLELTTLLPKYGFNTTTPRQCCDLIFYCYGRPTRAAGSVEIENFPDEQRRGIN